MATTIQNNPNTPIENFNIQKMSVERQFNHLLERINQCKKGIPDFLLREYHKIRSRHVTLMPRSLYTARD